MIVVHAHLSLPPENVPSFVAFMAGYVEQTLDEPGCHVFELTGSIDGSATFTMVECWEDERALRAHFLQPSVAAFREHRDAESVDVSGTVYYSDRSAPIVEELRRLLG